MQDHRSADDASTAGANPSPAIANVHGLGESHALRVDLEPVQVPWLADEVDTLRAATREALTGRQGVDQAQGEIGDELDRRRYRLRVLALIRGQLRLSDAVVAAVVRGPWQEPTDLAWEAAGITAPVTVVGPARAMLVLIRGAARNVADALGEALHGPDAVATSNPVSPGYLMHWPELSRLTPAVATRLRDLAEATRAFTDTYVAAVAQHAYTFDPEHYPVLPDELW